MLVTGATSGLGLSIAGRLAAAGTTTIVHGPDSETVAAARAELATRHPESRIHGAVADFSSQNEVWALAANIQDRFDSIDVLVSNAAAVFDRWSTNDDGVELTFAVNHLAPYLLSRLLLPALERNGGGRIVIVGSEAHRRATWDPDGLGSSDPYERFEAYAHSKLAILLFNAELARRLDGRSVTTNAAHPGTVRTALFKPRHFGERIVMPIINLRGVTPEAAAKGIVWLADSPIVEGETGGYYHRGSRVEPSAQATDEQNGFELWKLSAELTDLPEDLD